MLFDTPRIDIKLAWRQMKLRPGFAAVVILTLAFGIGINTAVFAALYKTVLHPIAFRDPARLVVVHNRFPSSNLTRLNTSPFDYQDLQQQHELFANVGLYYFLDLNRTGVDQPQKVNAIAVTPSLFRVLDSQPILGRTFTADEAQPSAPRTVIIGESYWRREFAGTPDILNRTLDLNGEKHTIVGVMPDSFAFPNEVTEMWTPLRLKPSDLADPAKANYYLRMVARLAPGLDFDRATTQITNLSRQLAASATPGTPRARKSWEMFAVPMAQDNDGSLRRWMSILFASVSALLLIVCLNVAGLLLMRSYERRSAIGVRLALGASQRRILRQLLTEALLLSALGGTAGIALAQLGTLLLTKYGPMGTVHINSPVAAFSIGLTLLTSLLCGVLPGWTAARNNSILHLQSAATQRTTRRAVWQRPLIIAQIATATILMVSGGLLIQSLARLLDTPLGFNAHNVTTLQISLPPARYEAAARTAFWHAFQQDVAAIPGVESVSAITSLPFGYGENVNTFEIVGRPKPPIDSFAEMANVLPNYFETMHIPLLRGRTFTQRDTDSAHIAAIDRSFADRYFPNEDPIGRQIKVPWGTFTITGVVGSIKSSALDATSEPTVYSPAPPLTDLSVVIRTTSASSNIVNTVRRVVTGIDKDQPIYDVFPMEALVARSLKTRQFVMWLITVFAAAGTLLSALGLYGLISYRVATQKQELGIRKAIGASNPAIAWLICRGGLSLVTAGIVLGSAGAIAAQRYIESQLYGIGFADPTVWLSVVMVLFAAGTLACAVPVRRAIQTSPMEALRPE